MNNKNKISSRTLNAIRVGFFIANRQISSNVGTTLLIIIVMTLTYLNLLVVSGLMVGIVQGLRDERQMYQTGDIILTNYSKDDFIPNSSGVLSYLNALPTIESYTPRYVTSGYLQGNYSKKVKITDNADTINANIAGIDPIAEDATTNLSSLVVEGEYLQPSDYNQILVGSSLLGRYKQLNANPGSFPIPNVGVGDRIRVFIDGVEREMTIKGIIGSKLAEITLRAFVVDSELRSMLNRTNNGVNEIAIRLSPGANAVYVQSQIKQSSVGTNAKVELPLESEPAFFQDFASTFNKLGSILGSIGLIIAFIAIFILVFVNTTTRRRSIGILQAIGIRSSAVEFGYAVQSVLYAVAGITIGSLVLFGILEPYFASHPIDFPFSSGVLQVAFSEATIKASVLLVAILLASFIPARMIMRQEVVDAILGR